MVQMTIVVAKNEGSLAGVASTNGFTIIPGTTKQFNTLMTLKDLVMAPAGTVDVGQDGWIALATRD